MRHLTVILCSLVAAVLFLAGCSDGVSVRVTEQKTGHPVSGALVHRDRPASRFGKITNPVGTTYHPLTTADSRWTDTNGTCVLTKLEQTDVLRIYVATATPLSLTVGDRVLSLSPGTNTFTSWVYSVWQEAGSPKILVEQPSWDWQKEKRQ